VGQQLRGGRRGDEPVDQDGLTVGDGGNDAGQVGAGTVVGGAVRPGDRVRVMETRPLSATKRWRLVEILEKAK